MTPTRKPIKIGMGVSTTAMNPMANNKPRREIYQDTS